MYTDNKIYDNNREQKELDWNNKESQESRLKCFIISLAEYFGPGQARAGMASTSLSEEDYYYKLRTIHTKQVKGPSHLFPIAAMLTPTQSSSSSSLSSIEDYDDDCCEVDTNTIIGCASILYYNFTALSTWWVIDPTMSRGSFRCQYNTISIK